MQQEYDHNIPPKKRMKKMNMTIKTYTSQFFQDI